MASRNAEGVDAIAFLCEIKRTEKRDSPTAMKRRPQVDFVDGQSGRPVDRSGFFYGG
jgi:hypothetical protein